MLYRFLQTLQKTSPCMTQAALHSLGAAGRSNLLSPPSLSLLQKFANILIAKKEQLYC